MIPSKLGDTQIVSILNEVEPSMSAKDLCRTYSVSSATYCKWQGKYGRLSVSELKRM